MREFRASRWSVEIALLRTRTPSRCRASRASWRWWEVNCLVSSSEGESVMEVIAGVGGLLIVAVGPGMRREDIEWREIYIPPACPPHLLGQLE